MNPGAARGALPPLDVAGAPPPPSSVTDVVAALNLQLSPASKRPMAGQPGVPLDRACLFGDSGGRLQWIQPSGAREPGQGVNEEEQGVVTAERTASGGVMLRVTLLAAGFLIGPSGNSVRQLCKITGTDIKSWTERRQENSPTRVFTIEGRRPAVELAIDIMCLAIQRYKQLCEGAYCGAAVDSLQIIRGVSFHYQPPPKQAVPYAAALKTHTSRAPRGGGGGLTRTQSSDSPGGGLRTAGSGALKAYRPPPPARKTLAFPDASRPGGAGAPPHAKPELEAWSDCLTDGEGGLPLAPPVSLEALTRAGFASLLLADGDAQPPLDAAGRRLLSVPPAGSNSYAAGFTGVRLGEQMLPSGLAAAAWSPQIPLATAGAGRVPVPAHLTARAAPAAAAAAPAGLASSQYPWICGPHPFLQQ